MGVKVLEAHDADMARIFEVFSLAFARNEPFFDVLYPQHWTDAGRKAGAERLQTIKNSDPQTTFLKAVDESTGEICGAAKWNVYDNKMPDLDTKKPLGDHWGTEDEAEFAGKMIESFLELRNAAIKKSNGNLLSLDILGIDPAHQRKGIGGALVSWGTHRADQLGVEAIVESSVFGKGLYVKSGFVFVKDVRIQPPEQWAGREAAEFAWLVRPKRQ